jgi:hypothetical protein
VWGVESGIPADLLLFVWVVERNAILDPAGPNGQSEYPSVLRELFPVPQPGSTAGEALGKLAPGEHRRFDYVFDLPSGIDPKELAAVAFRATQPAAHRHPGRDEFILGGLHSRWSGAGMAQWPAAGAKMMSAEVRLLDDPPEASAHEREVGRILSLQGCVDSVPAENPAHRRQRKRWDIRTTDGEVRQRRSKSRRLPWRAAGGDIFNQLSQLQLFSQC